jgi:hypothetical protein
MQNRIDGFQLRPVSSRLLFYWLLVAHALAVLAIWQLQSNMTVKLILILALTLHFAWTIYRHLLLLGRHAVTEAKVTQEGVWYLTFGNGESQQAQLLPDSFIKPWLIILNFKTAPFRPVKHLVLFKDSLEKSVARNLRIYLKQTKGARP